VDEVAAQHGLPIKDVYGKSRRAHLVAARRCAIRRIREETTLKLTANRLPVQPGSQHDYPRSEGRTGSERR